MNPILVPAFLDAETAHRRERISSEWGRPWFTLRRGTELPVRRGGQERSRVVATDHAVVAAR